jgi:hypothetical protein
MAVAVQQVLRERVPVEYFGDIGKYRDLKTAGPMLVYQASPPFRGKKRTELTYDVLNPALIAMLFRRAWGIFPAKFKRKNGRPSRSAGISSSSACIKDATSRILLQLFWTRRKTRWCTIQT